MVKRYVPFLLLLAFVLHGVSGAYAAKKHKEAIAALPETYRAWLEEVELLISEKELVAFLEIEKDYQRDAFIEQFWKLRDPFPDTSRNEFKERWDVRVREAREQFSSLREDRSTVLLLNGFPDARMTINCLDLWPTEAWFYQRAENLGHEVALLFYQTGSLGQYRLWYPSEGLRILFRNRSPLNDAGRLSFEDLIGCDQEEKNALIAAVRWGQRQGALGFTSIAAKLSRPPTQSSGEWAETFKAYSTEIPDGAETFAASLTVNYPGRYKARTVVQAMLAIDRTELAEAQFSSYRSYNLLVVGEVLREGKLFDHFRYSYNHPLETLSSETVPLIFERNLRPGGYTVILRLEDVNGKRFSRIEQALEVPKVDTRVVREPSDPEVARLLEEANRAIDAGETLVKIVPLQGDLHTGMVRVDTLTSGEEIDRIAFSVDGQHILLKKNPPWSVELDLGPLPRMRTLTAVGYDKQEREVANDELVLNAGAHRFAARLLEPRKGKKYNTSLRAVAEVEVPEDRAVERVEFFLNETLVATLYQPPYTHPILLPEGEAVAYVRVVAYQPDGNSTEDLVFVNAPEYLEEVDIQFVELYAAALDRNKRPVDTLRQEEFSIIEDKQPQTILRFDRVENLPIHAGVLIDISASMVDNLERAQLAALEFFQQAVTPKDRVALVTFNDHPNLVAKFTNDVEELAGGLAGLKAERGTALYDSLIFAFYYFNGVKGQRALVLLSDGQDEHSRFSFEDTLEYARRAGVALYAIGLNLNRKQGDAARKLRQLSAETGGRFFPIEEIGELESVYREIQRELRSRYYIAYQSTNTSDSGDFRTIEVQLARPGVEAKTMRGYYP